MAQEIKVPCTFWPHRGINANGYYDHVVAANNFYQQQGVVMPDDLDTRVCFDLAGVIPTNINAAPAGILRVYWEPVSATGTLKIFYDIYAAAAESSSIDPAGAGTVTGSFTDTASGAFQGNFTDIALTALAASLISTNWVFGVLERRALSDAADTMEANVAITKILFVANT